MTRVFPGLEQIRELPVQIEMVIPPEWEDRNGHVNVQYYLALYELGGWVILEEVGIHEEWFQQHQELNWAAPVCGLMNL